MRRKCTQQSFSNHFARGSERDGLWKVHPTCVKARAEKPVVRLWQGRERVMNVSFERRVSRLHEHKIGQTRFNLEFARACLSDARRVPPASRLAERGRVKCPRYVQVLP